MANFLNVKRQTYSAYERGISTPDAITLDKLANFFDCTIDYLLGRGEKSNSDELFIPKDLKGVQVAFHRGEFEDLTQDEVDALAVLAKTLKEQRKKKEKY